MFREFQSYDVKMFRGDRLMLQATQGGQTPAKALAGITGGNGLAPYIKKTGRCAWEAKMGNDRWVVTR